MGEEIFIPQSKTILNLFEGSTHYQVPNYQRPYSWDTERVETLWDDLFTAYQEGMEEYFLGSLILIRNDDNKRLDIVDGQQRITTLMILFCALRDLYYNNLDDIKKKNLILGRIKNLENDSERLILRTQTHNQNTFEQEILNNIDFSKDRTKKEITENTFLNAAYIFKEKIDKIKNEPETLEKFTKYLLEKVRVITIDCTSKSFAIKLFQVLNTRGMDLTSADLIKSFLMSKLKEEDLASFEQDWIYIERKAKEFNETLNDLFTYYEYYLLASNPKKSLYDELERQFINKDPKKIVYEFKKLISYFAEIDSEDSEVIYSLYYLKHFYWKSILLTAKLEGWETNQFNRLAKEISRFYYLYWISDYTSTKTKQTSFNIISWIKDKKDLTYISQQLNEKIENDGVIGKALNNLNGNIYDFSWCKRILTLIEYNQTDSSNKNFIDIDKSVHVEHILPQGYKKIDYWTNLYSTNDADKLVNTLGNLTLLSGKKNIEASNRPFPDKMDIYKGKGIDGMTGYLVTQKIYNDSLTNKDWDINKINERKNFLLNEISKILEIDLNKKYDDKVEEIEEERDPIISSDEKEELRLDFWTKLLDKAKLKTDLHANISPSRYHWIGKSSGKPGIFYNYVILNSDAVCEIYLDKGKEFTNPNINKSRFDELFKHKDEIEKVFNDQLYWERLDVKRASRISFGFNLGLYNKDKWDEIQDKMIDIMIRLEKSTKQYIMQLE